MNIINWLDNRLLDEQLHEAKSYQKSLEPYRTREEPYMFREEINTTTMPEEEQCVIRFNHLDEMLNILRKDNRYIEDEKTGNEVRQLILKMQTEKNRLAQKYLDLIQDKSKEETEG